MHISFHHPSTRTPKIIIGYFFLSIGVTVFIGLMKLWDMCSRLRQTKKPFDVLEVMEWLLYATV
jgi:hypothetical protein